MLNSRDLSRYINQVSVILIMMSVSYGSETWPMKVEHELKLTRTEMNMIRWMCGVKLNERKKSEELGKLFKDWN